MEKSQTFIKPCTGILRYLSEYAVEIQYRFSIMSGLQISGTALIENEGICRINFKGLIVGIYGIFISPQLNE